MPYNLPPGTTLSDIDGPSHRQCQRCGDTFRSEQLNNELYCQSCWENLYKQQTPPAEEQPPIQPTC